MFSRYVFQNFLNSYFRFKKTKTIINFNRIKRLVTPYLLFLIIIILITANIRIAEGDIHYGSLKINPFFSLEGGYLDNINLERRGKETSAALILLKPGFGLNWNKTKFDLNIVYLYKIFEYTSNRNRIENREDYDFSSNINLKMGQSGNYFNIAGAYKYVATTEPTTIEERSERHKDSTIGLGFKLILSDRFKFATSPLFKSFNYTDPTFSLNRDRDTLIINNIFGITPFPKTWVLLQYRYEKTEYEHPNNSIVEDSRTNSLLTGLEWDATEKISGQIKGGYTWRDYLNTNPKINQRYSPKTWAVEIEIKYTPSDYTGLNLGYERTISDSYYEREESNNKNESIGGPYYSNRLKLNISHNLTYKILTRVNFNYYFSEYQKEDRREDLFQTSLALEYLFKRWIKGKFSYSYWNKQTNIDQPNIFSYSLNQILLGVDLLF